MMASKRKRPGVKPGQRKRKRDGVPCPFCQHTVSAVKSVGNVGVSVVRWRQCAKCAKRFRTSERTGTNTDIAALNTDIAKLIDTLKTVQRIPAPSVPIIEGTR